MKCIFYIAGGKKLKQSLEIPELRGISISLFFFNRMVLMNLESATVPKDKAGRIRIEEFEGLQTAKLTSPAIDTKNKHFIFPDDDELSEKSTETLPESDFINPVLEIQHNTPPTLNSNFDNNKSIHTLSNDETVTVLPKNIKVSCESIRPPDEIDYLNHTLSDESTHSLLNKNSNSNNSNNIQDGQNQIIVKQKQLCCVFF